MPGFPGTRYFYPSVNSFDSPVITDQNPAHTMTAYYVNATGELLSYNLSSQTTTNLHAWPTNLSNYNSSNMLDAFQQYNGSVSVLYEMGQTATGYVWLAWYSLYNSTYYFVNTTIDATGAGTNQNGGIYNESGWVFWSNNYVTTLAFFNIFSRQLVTATLASQPAWNSAVYVPTADQVVEDTDASNGTLQVLTFNLTSLGGRPTISAIDHWGGSVSGGDLENMPYLFSYNATTKETDLWGMGQEGTTERVMNITLQQNMSNDSNPSVTATGSVGATDETAFAFWDDSGYFLNGYDANTRTAAYQAGFLGPLNRSVILATNSPWFNAFLSSYNFGFGGGPWVNQWQYIGPSSGWSGAIVQNGTSSGRSCGSVCTLTIYWVTSRGSPLGLPGSPPGAPASLTEAAVTASSVSLSWTNPSGSGVLNDTVYVAAGSTCTGALQGYSTNRVATTYTVGSLTASSQYSFEVRAWNTVGQGAASSCLTVATPSGDVAPGPPTGLSAMAVTNDEVALSWTNPARGTFGNISVDYGVISTSLIHHISIGGTSDTGTIKSLSPATTYYFEVVAWNGTTPSPPSNEINATTNYPSPSAPTRLTLTANTTTTLSFSWANPATGTYDNISLALGTVVNDTVLRLSVGNGTSFTITGLAPGTHYYVRALAWNHTSPSAASNQLYASTNFTTPAVPGGLDSPGTTSTSVSLQWTNPANGTFTNITVFYHRIGGSNSTLSVGISSSATVAGLLSGTQYYFAVQAYNHGSASSLSAFLPVTTRPESGGSEGGGGGDNSSNNSTAPGCGHCIGVQGWIVIGSGVLLAVVGGVSAVVTRRWFGALLIVGGLALVLVALYW